MFQCEIFNILFSYEDEDTARFSNLLQCTFKNIAISTSPILHHVNSNRELSDSQLSLFCSFVGRLNWALQATRPDAAFNMIYLSTKMKNACEKDLVQVQKVIRCLQNNPLSTRYPKLCQYESCIVILLMHHMPISMKELAVSEHMLYFLLIRIIIVVC